MRLAAILVICAAVIALRVTLASAAGMSPMEQFERDNMLTKNEHRPIQPMESMSQWLDINGTMVSLNNDDLIPIEPPCVFQTILDDGSTVLILKHTNGTLRNAIMMSPNDNNFVQVAPMSDGQFVSFFMNETDEEQLRQTSYGEAGDILTPDIINGDPDGSNASLFSNRKLSWDDSNAPKICSEFTVIRTAMRFDSGLCAANYNDRLQTEAYLHFLVAIANQWFTAPGLCLKIEVCNIKGHCNGFHGSDEFRDLIEGAPSDCRFDTDPLQSLVSICQLHVPRTIQTWSTRWSM